MEIALALQQLKELVLEMVELVMSQVDLVVAVVTEAQEITMEN